MYIIYTTRKHSINYKPHLKKYLVNNQTVNLSITKVRKGKKLNDINIFFSFYDFYDKPKQRVLGRVTTFLRIQNGTLGKKMSVPSHIEKMCCAPKFSHDHKTLLLLHKCISKNYVVFNVYAPQFDFLSKTRTRTFDLFNFSFL